MIKKNVTVYTNEMNCELEYNSESGDYKLWTDGQMFNKRKLEDLYRFLSEVLVDMGTVVEDFSPKIEPKKVEVAPMQSQFRPEVI